MLKDFMRRKEIVEKSTSIANDIMNRYPPELDVVMATQNKSGIKKQNRKLVRALQMGRMDIDRAIAEMGLGVYGKAKFYQTIQEAMLDKGYTEESARIMMEEFVVTL